MSAEMKAVGLCVAFGLALLAAAAAEAHAAWVRALR